MTHRQKFKETWITSLMESLEERFDLRARTALMEDCGRACARRSTVHPLADSCDGDVDKLVGGLARLLGKENCSREGGIVRLKYPRCFCELVNNGPERLLDTYCLCSRGWLVEMFETAAKKIVEVDVLRTIKRGDPHCEFVVRI